MFGAIRKQTFSNLVMIGVAAGLSAVMLVLSLALPLVISLMSLCALACAVRLYGHAKSWQTSLAWALTGAVLMLSLRHDPTPLSYGGFFPALSLTVTLLFLLAANNLPLPDLRFQWKLLASSWAVLTLGFWLAVTYVDNWRLLFCLGLAAGVLVLFVLKWKFTLPPALILTVNTLILLLIGLPLADALTRPDLHLPARPDLRLRLYSYDVARKNPTAFGHWWYYFVREWSKPKHELFVKTRNALVPYRLRPGSEGTMFESRIHVNKLGFRGPEIKADKGRAYRIVALGESTTFGHTMYSDDVPWPRLLERMLTNRFGNTHPIQVINAGIPGYDLKMNLYRLRQTILALKPDLIISYHGYNGFHWLLPNLPRVSAPPPPAYRERPVKLLADAEYRFKVLSYRRRVRDNIASPATPAGDFQKNAYLQGYRELVDLTRSNHVHLVLANYSMAVNSGSDLDVIAFYRAGFPDVLNYIRANEMHSRIVSTVADANSNVTYVDTHPALDGQYDNFIDLVHFTQPGREAMAETIFEAIVPVLENDLDDGSRKASAEPHPIQPG